MSPSLDDYASDSVESLKLALATARSFADDARADRDRWCARALDAESKVDGQAWVDLTAERDNLYAFVGELVPLVEAAKAWRATLPTDLDNWLAGSKPGTRALVAAVDALNRGNPDLRLTTVSDPCPVCGQDNWPAGSAGNARRIHELAEHEGDPRIKPRWWHEHEHDAEPGPDLRLSTEAEADEQAAESRR